MSGSSMLFEARDDIIAVVHDHRPPRDSEWEAYMGECRRILAKHGRERILVSSEGGGPSSAQRRSLKEMFKGQPQRVAVMAPRLTRGIIIALSWFNPEVRAFRPDELEQAIEYLRLDPAQADWGRDAIWRMRSELQIPAKPALGVNR